MPASKQETSKSPDSLAPEQTAGTRCFNAISHPFVGRSGLNDIEELLATRRRRSPGEDVSLTSRTISPLPATPVAPSSWRSWNAVELEMDKEAEDSNTAQACRGHRASRRASLPPSVCAAVSLLDRRDRIALLQEIFLTWRLLAVSRGMREQLLSAETECSALRLHNQHLIEKVEQMTKERSSNGKDNGHTHHCVLGDSTPHSHTGGFNVNPLTASVQECKRPVVTPVAGVIPVTNGHASNIDNFLADPSRSAFGKGLLGSCFQEPLMAQANNVDDSLAVSGISVLLESETSPRDYAEGCNWLCGLETESAAIVGLSNVLSKTVASANPSSFREPVAGAVCELGRAVLSAATSPCLAAVAVRLLLDYGARTTERTWIRLCLSAWHALSAKRYLLRSLLGHSSDAHETLCCFRVLLAWRRAVAQRSVVELRCAVEMAWALRVVMLRTALRGWYARCIAHGVDQLSPLPNSSCSSIFWSLGESPMSKDGQACGLTLSADGDSTLMSSMHTSARSSSHYHSAILSPSPVFAREQGARSQDGVSEG